MASVETRRLEYWWTCPIHHSMYPLISSGKSHYVNLNVACECGVTTAPQVLADDIMNDLCTFEEHDPSVATVLSLLSSALQMPEYEIFTGSSTPIDWDEVVLPADLKGGDGVYSSVPMVRPITTLALRPVCSSHGQEITTKPQETIMLESNHVDVGNHTVKVEEVKPDFTVGKLTTAALLAGAFVLGGVALRIAQYVWPLTPDEK